MVDVELTMCELQQAALVGVQRRLRAIYGHRRTVVLARNGTMQGQWGVDIEAAAAEMAVAKFRGDYWADNRAPDYDGDVGKLHIRSTDHPDGHLLIYPDDPDDGVFILVTVQVPTFRIVGGIRAKVAKRHAEWRNERMRVPCWAVPQCSLWPMPNALRQ